MEPPGKRPTKDFNKVAGEITYLEFCLKPEYRERYQKELKEKNADYDRLKTELEKNRSLFQKEETAKLTPPPPSYIQTKDQRTLEITQAVDKRIADKLNQHKEQTQTWQKTFLEQMTGQKAPEKGKSSPSDRSPSLQERFMEKADRRQQEHGRRRDDRER